MHTEFWYGNVLHGAKFEDRQWAGTVTLIRQKEVDAAGLRSCSGARFHVRGVQPSLSATVTLKAALHTRQDT